MKTPILALSTVKRETPATFDAEYGTNELLHQVPVLTEALAGDGLEPPPHLCLQDRYDTSMGEMLEYHVGRP